MTQIWHKQVIQTGVTNRNYFLVFVGSVEKRKELRYDAIMKSELVSKEFQEDSIDMMKSFIKTLEESGSTSPPAADVLEQWLQHIE